MVFSRLSWRFSLALLAASGAGCELLLATDETQCTTDADCVAKGGAGFACVGSVCRASASTSDGSTDDSSTGDASTGPWACLDDLPAVAPEDNSRPVTIRSNFLAYSLDDCQQNAPVPGMKVQLCSIRDPSCSSPIETEFTGCDGFVTLTAAYVGFQGYLLLAPPKPSAPDGDAGDGGPSFWPPAVIDCYRTLQATQAAADAGSNRCAVHVDEAGVVSTTGDPSGPLPFDLMPSMSMLSPPPTMSDDLDAAINEISSPHIFSASTITGLLLLVQKPLSPTAGHVFGIAEDCQDNPTAGVFITVTGGLGPDSLVYYTDSSGGVSVTQGATSSRGETGYVNLEPGATGINTVSVTATRKDTNQTIGQYTALIRTGYITLLAMTPLKN